MVTRAPASSGHMGVLAEQVEQIFGQLLRHHKRSLSMTPDVFAKMSEVAPIVAANLGQGLDDIHMVVDSSMNGDGPRFEVACGESEPYIRATRRSRASWRAQGRVSDGQTPSYPDVFRDETLTASAECHQSRLGLAHSDLSSHVDAVRAPMTSSAHPLRDMRSMCVCKNVDAPPSGFAQVLVLGFDDDPDWLWGSTSHGAGWIRTDAVREICE